MVPDEMAQARSKVVGLALMAEREGFEPPIPVKVCRFSRPEPSTTRPPLRLLQFYYSTWWSPLRSGSSLFVFHTLQRPSEAVQRFSRPEPINHSATSPCTTVLLQSGGLRLQRSAASRIGRYEAGQGPVAEGFEQSCEPVRRLRCLRAV